MQIVKNIQTDGAKAPAMSAALLDRTLERVTAPVDNIVAAAQAGSPAAFEELHSIYSERLYRTILSFISETFPRSFTSWPPHRYRTLR
jgi:hypothetical protein